MNGGESSVLDKLAAFLDNITQCYANSELGDLGNKSDESQKILNVLSSLFYSHSFIKRSEKKHKGQYIRIHDVISFETYFDYLFELLS